MNRLKSMMIQFPDNILVSRCQTQKHITIMVVWQDSACNLNCGTRIPCIINRESDRTSHLTRLGSDRFEISTATGATKLL